MRPAITLPANTLLAAAFFVASAVVVHAQAPTADPSDKYTWLEEVSSDRSMSWVKAENARTADVLEKDPHFAPDFAAALEVAEDPNRLPVPQLRGGMLYNNWRDAKNPRGLLRKTTVADYLTPNPHWQTVLDLDALGATEKVGWVNHGLDCLYPGDRLCFVRLSAGGEDATTMREFDLHTGQFVPGGLVLPHGKQSANWLDPDTLLVERDWGPGSMTTSGYPYIVKQWKRGTPLESSTEIFRGAPTDEDAGARVLHDAQGDVVQLFVRNLTFFESQTSIRTPRGIERLAIPAKAQVADVLAGRLLVELREDWTPIPGSKPLRQGSLLELRLADVLKDPAHLHPVPIFEPTTQEFFQEAATTRDRLIVTTLEHVQGRAYAYTPATTGWTRQSLSVPENSTVDIASTSNTDNRFFLHITGFLTPPSVLLGDAATAQLQPAKSQPALFNAANDMVDQYEATSKDGTKVPYFVVHPRSMKLNGLNPTLLNAYGGFEVSMTPEYSAYDGKLWLEHGGVLVLANIRGGGEFGPAWHEAGLNIHRQRIYDDFAAVGQDLVTRKITSPEHLGIIGGSNGGLLMGVEMEQQPALWKAVVIQVPLLDMLGFEHIAAGASWVGEYGSVSNPEQRAFLAGISPYNNLRSGVAYPEPLIFTTTKDDRVGPQHARKFAAKMEEFHLPFFYDEITEGGHGAGADLKQEARTYALTYTYLARKLAPSASPAAQP